MSDILWYAQTDWKVLISSRGRLPVIIPLWLCSRLSEMQLNLNLNYIPFSKQKPCHFEVLAISEDSCSVVSLLTPYTIFFVNLFLLPRWHGNGRCVHPSHADPDTHQSLTLPCHCTAGSEAHAFSQCENMWEESDIFQVCSNWSISLQFLQASEDKACLLFQALWWSESYAYVQLAETKTYQKYTERRAWVGKSHKMP